MCDAVFQEYANAINGFTSTTSDVVPGLLLFSTTQCGGVKFPNVGGVGFESNQYSSNDMLTAATYTPILLGNPISFFIPFTYKLVTMKSTTGGFTSQFVGPFFTTDASLLAWQTDPAGSNMVANPIAEIFFNDILIWAPPVVSTPSPVSQALLPQCLGKLEFLGPFSLVRFTPQSERCDAFMTDTWCAEGTTTLNNEECSCFKELPDIEQKSEDLGVALPVICFGEKCATENTYKTLMMLSRPCNLTICQQTVSSTPGIINEGQDTVFCGGQFFKQNGQIANPSVSPIPGPSNPTSGEEAPFYVWIMLGASGILFLVLVYLLFAAPPKHGSSILRQIRKIAQARKSSRATRPDFGTTFDDVS